MILFEQIRLSMERKSEKTRIIFVHNMGGEHLFCPMATKLVKLKDCLKCQYNVGQSYHKLASDEIRGRGFVECSFV